MKPLFQLFAFLLELCLLAAIGYWGFRFGETTLLKYVYGIGLPLIAAILWGIFAAPKSKRRLEFSYRLIFESILFILAAFLLYNAGQRSLAILFIFIIAIRQIGSTIYKW